MIDKDLKIPYQIKNIRMEGNEHGQLASDVIYAELVDDDGTLVISATLQYILKEIRNRNYPVENVTVERGVRRGVMTSTVHMKRYR